MIPENAKVVFFDLFGTLVIYGDMPQAWDDWLAAFRGALEASGMEVDPETFSARCEGFFSRPEPAPRDDGLTVLERRIETFCRELGWDPPSSAAPDAAVAMIEAWQAYITPDPEARTVLESLGRRKRIALVSNYDHPPHVHLLLKDLSLADFFHAVVVSGEVGVKKPDPGIFEVAMAKTKAQPHEVVHVGDAPEDVEGAKAAEIRPILIRRARDPDRRILRDYSRGRDALMGDGAGKDRNVTVISKLGELLGPPVL
ncbi:MAG: HAD family hydrolase [Planctomycetota bacterium]|jgi:HAD superfamily hydrolase (TIGR01549 family)